jgi:hypothetical protein
MFEWAGRRAGLKCVRGGLRARGRPHFVAAGAWAPPGRRVCRITAARSLNRSRCRRGRASPGPRAVPGVLVLQARRAPQRGPPPRRAAGPPPRRAGAGDPAGRRLCFCGARRPRERVCAAPGAPVGGARVAGVAPGGRAAATRRPPQPAPRAALTRELEASSRRAAPHPPWGHGAAASSAPIARASESCQPGGVLPGSRAAAAP